MDFKPSDRLTLSDWQEDRPTTAEGVLIPRTRTRTYRRSRRASWVLAVPVLLLLGAFALVGSSALFGTSSPNMAALPQALLERGVGTADQGWSGAVPVLDQPAFYNDTREAFIAEALSFLDVDVAQGQVRYFVEGVLVFTAPIVATPARDSWWYVPSGLYEVHTKEDRFFSSFGQFYLPSAIRFAGNYVIHGAPELPDGTPVPSVDADGGITLEDRDAARLAALVAEGVPVVVHNPVAVARSTFILNTPIAGITAPHYLVFDVESATPLVAFDAETAVPIASITKLMSALVAAEQLNLDQTVTLPGETGVLSMVPRLNGRRSLSLYTLLQLLLAESSNEAAEVLAQEFGRTEFVAAMNDTATRIGLTNTTFVDPSGLADGNRASALDLVTLLTYIERHHPFILTLTREADLPAAYQRNAFPDLINFNQFPSGTTFVGGKVGETLAAGQTSVSLHEVQLADAERQVVVVVLGATDRTEDVTRLLQYTIDRAANDE